MALKLNYNYRDVDVKDAYLKIMELTIKDEVINSTKEFLIDIDYEVRATKTSQPFCSEKISFIGNPEISIYEQSYDFLKSLFPTSIDI